MARHRGMVAPINSVKHIVQRASVSVASGGLNSTVVVDAIAKDATRSNTSDVSEGAIVKAIFVELWLKSDADAGTSTQFVVTFEKLVSDAASITNAEMLALQAYTNKKNIFFTSQGVLGDLTTQAIPVIRQWIAIPKGKQRMGFSDRMIINTAPVGFAIDVCGVFIYKEYY